MATRKVKEPAVQFLAGFKPLNCMWEGADAPCPSEDSARWEVRKLRPELARAQALAIHRGKTYIHLERYLRVAETVAIRKGSGWSPADDAIRKDAADAAAHAGALLSLANRTADNMSTGR